MEDSDKHKVLHGQPSTLAGDAEEEDVLHDNLTKFCRHFTASEGTDEKAFTELITQLHAVKVRRAALEGVIEHKN